MSSTTVDNRVLQMKFDNASFEKNIQTSLGSLAKLNKSLEMSESTKGLQGISDAANKVDLSGIRSGVETLEARFSALQVMAVTALANITNSALNAGKNIVKALTVDPIMTGLSEYETKINAIQVIQANTMGVNTMSDITKALDELNTYADKTIYNFAEMTSNVGKFVAQGLNIQDATNAIQGMANLAAASGASAEDMSRATYQMSQALGGTIRKIDWNSLRNANMATTTLKNTLMEIAKVKNIDIDGMIKAEGTFEDTLQAGWLTGDLFTQAMNIYSGAYTAAELKAQGFGDEQVKKFQDLAKMAQDAATQVKTLSQLWSVLKETAQSGWTQSWEYIFGDFEGAKKSFTQAQVYFSDIINASADARNAVLKAWNTGGGRDMGIQALQNTFKGLLSVVTPIKEAMTEIFPPITATQLLKLTEAVRDFTAGLTLSSETSANVKSTFKGLFAVVDILGQAFGAFVSSIFPMLGGVENAAGGVLKLTGSFGEFLVSLDETIRKTGFFTTIFNTLSTVLRTGMTGIKAIIAGVVTGFQEFIAFAQQNLGFPSIEVFYNMLQRVYERMSNIMQSSQSLKDSVNGAFLSIAQSAAFATFSTSMDKIVTFLKSVWKVIKMVGQGIGDAIGNLTSGLVDVTGSINFDAVFDVINSGLFVGLLVGLKKFGDGFTGVFKDISKTVGTLTSIKEAVLDTFGAFQDQLKAGTLLKIATAIALLAASLAVLSLIDSKRLTVALVAVTGLFADLMASMTIFTKITPTGLKSAASMTTIMIGMSVAILILSGAMVKLSGLDWEGIAKGVISIAALSAILVGVAKVLSESSGKMIAGTVGLLIFTVAIRNLVDVVRELGSMDTETLLKGLIGVGVIVTELALFMTAANFGKMGVSTGLGLLALSAAINILATSVQVFGLMDTEALLKGLVALGVVLTELSLFIQVNSGAKGMIFAATGMVILGAAIQILADAVSQLGAMSADALIKGLTSMGIALGVVTLALNLMPSNMIFIGVGLIAVSAALMIMSNALITLSGMTWEGVAKGLVALAGGLAVIALAVNLMSGALVGAAALLVVAGALAIFVPTLIMLSMMSWEEIAKGLVTLAGAFAVLGIAGAVLTPLIPSILGLSAAFALIGLGIAAAGVGLMAIGVGLTAVAAGFAALALIGVAGATSVVAALTIIIEGIATMIPFVLQKIGEGLIALAQVFIESAPVIVEAIVVIIESVVTGLVAVIPLVVDGVFQLLVAVLEAIVQYTPQIVESALTILVEILQGIANALPSIIQAGVDIIVAFIQGVSSASVQLVQAAYTAMITFINGLATCIDQNTPVLTAAITRLINSIINASILILTSAINPFKERGRMLMQSGVIQGISEKIEEVKAAVTSVVSNALTGISKFYQSFKEAGNNIINGFIDGIKEKFNDAINTASDLGTKILDSAKSALGIHSPSKEFAEVGRFSVMGLVTGLKEYASGAYAAASDMATGTIDAMKKPFNNISSIIDGNMNLSPVVRPTLDLTDITNGVKTISSMFNNQQVGVTTVNGQNGGSELGSGGVNFIQNNYSPKALSRTEIYRQTNNQLAALKERIGK